MTSELVLDHTIGFNGSIPDSMFVHPNGESLVYVGGGCLVVNDLKKRSKQVFLRGHDNTLTCGAISYSGTYLASGQLGNSAEQEILAHSRYTKFIHEVETHNLFIDLQLTSLA